MKPQKREEEYKKFIKMRDRIHEIYGLMRDLPYEPTEKKIFAGHWRFFKVREDILRSSIGAQVKMVVDKCNTWILGNKNDPDSYKQKIWSTGELREYQALRSLSEKEFNESGFPDFFTRKWFVKEVTYKNVGTKNLEIIRFRPNIPPHMIEYAFKRAYKCAFKMLDGDLEGELDRLQRTMNNENGWAKIAGNNYDEWDRNEKKKKNMKKIARRELREELAEF